MARTTESRSHVSVYTVCRVFCPHSPCLNAQHECIHSGRPTVLVLFLQAASLSFNVNPVASSLFKLKLIVLTCNTISISVIFVSYVSTVACAFHQFQFSLSIEQLVMQLHKNKKIRYQRRVKKNRPARNTYGA
jgi:hypothetical protein